MKLLSVDDSIFIFVHWSFILGQGSCLQSQNCLHPSFVIVYITQCGCIINCCFVVKAPANAIIHAEQSTPTWTNQFCYIFFSLVRNLESNPGFLFIVVIVLFEIIIYVVLCD